MKKRGKGVASIFYGTGYGNGFPDVSKATAELREDGKVVVYTGVTEVGQGAKTVMCQIAAEVLGLEVVDIVLINEDTSITPDAGTAAASRQTYNTGNAVRLAAENLKQRLIRQAVKELSLTGVTGLDCWQGRIFVRTYPERGISFRELALLNGVTF